jgi:hypothetical protein
VELEAKDTTLWGKSKRGREEEGGEEKRGEMRKAKRRTRGFNLYT